MSLVTLSSSSSDRSSPYWSTPDSPLSASYNNFYALRDLRGFTLHDGINEAFRAGGTDSPTTDDSSVQRRYHVFGTPTSQAGTVDDTASTNLEVEIVYGDVGMGMVRDVRGSGIGSRGSEALSGSIRSIRTMFRSEDRVDLPLARGGQGKTAWVLLDQPGTAVPEIRFGNIGRRLSVITTSDGTTSQKSGRADSSENQELISPLVLRLSTSPLLEARRSIESKFSEDLPKTRKGSSPIMWIKNRVKSRTNNRDIGNNVGERNKKGKNIPRRLQKRLSSIMVLQETTEPASHSNVNLQVQSSSRLGGTGAYANVSTPGANSDRFLDQLDDALRAARPISRMRELSTTILGAGRKLQTGPSPIKKVAQAASFNAIGHVQLPPRSKSVPPQQNKRNNTWDLEFLPSEAQGVKTPSEYPIYDKKHVGGKVMPLSQERRYFGLADMIQSQPPLAPAGEIPARLDPKDTSELTTCSVSILHSYSELDCHAIAPFITQDIQRPQSPAFTTAKDVVSATGKKMRRASVQARNIIMHRKLSDVNETPEASRSRRESDLGKGDNPTPDEVPRRVHSGRSAVKWIKRASPDSGGPSGIILRRGQYEPELEIVKPAEVIIEEARREKRDSRILGLDPDAYSSSTDDSFTYTSALQDIAGLSKRLKSPAAAFRTQELEIGELVTPPPPGYPRNSIAPGCLLHGDKIP